MWSGSGQTLAANWMGNNVPVEVGDLYIVPDPPSIAENPSIGLTGRNEVPLPTKYKDLDVDNINVDTINGDPYPLPPDKWSLYPAIHDVTATRTEAPFNLRQWDIKDFKDVDASSFHAIREGLPVPTGGQITADLGVSAPIGSFQLLSASTACQVDGSMVVNGPTTLDGGTIHGTSIGCLPVEGINTQRLDLLPVGIDMVSPTFITIDAAGAGNFACGGALSLAGGSYIEYNTDQNYFINTSAGNDFTDILVGNIHPAFEGTDNLRINGGGSGRGVYLDDGVMVRSKIHRTPQFSYFKVSWSADTFYSEFEEVDYEGVCYISQIANKNFPPLSSYQAYDNDTAYVVGNLVFVLSVVFVCIADTTGEFPPDNPSSWAVSGGILDEVWIPNGEKFINNQVSFDKEPADGYEWSLIKLKNSEGLRVMRKLIDVNTQVIGRLFDDTLYPPTTSTLVINSDLVMNGYSVLGALRVQPSQYNLTQEWLSSSVYYVDDLVIANVNKIYKCLVQNLNLEPNVEIPTWNEDGATYTIDNVVKQFSTGDNYICILGYTTTIGDPQPDTDTTHWASTTGGDITAFWELQGDAVRGSLEFQPTISDTTYLSMIKPEGINTLAILERQVGTNIIVNAGAIYDTGLNPAYIGGVNSLPVDGELDMDSENIVNIGTLRTNELGAITGGVGYISVLDQLEGTGKSIQNFNYLNLIGPATGDNATIDLRTTDLDIGLRMVVDADTGDATISANLNMPLTITTDNKLYLNGDDGIMANTLSMSGNIEMGSNDINSCANINTSSINSIANLFRRGNFCSLVDQTFTAGSTAEQQIQIATTLGTTNGISLNTSTYEISVDTDGSYKVDMTYQLDSTGGTHTHSYFWVKNNGTAIANSTQQKTAKNNEVQCVSYSRIFQLESGDKLTFWWNSSNSNDYLYHDAGISTPYVRPAQPSVAISVVSC